LSLLACTLEPADLPATPPNTNDCPESRRADDRGQGNDQLGTLSGRFVFDGEPLAPKDLFPDLTKIDAGQPQLPGPDGRFSGVEGVYREFLRHNIRPQTGDASLRVGPDGGIANVVIWVASKDIPWAPPRPEQPTTLRLQGGNFSPRVAAVAVGQPLLIENHDPVALNFSAEFTRALNSPINALLSPGAPNSPVRISFRSPESFPVQYGSTLGVWATGFVFVHRNAFVAVSQPDGSFTLPDLPVGEWEFRVWHERCGYVSHWPKGLFKQTIVSGENRLGTIKLTPEMFGRAAAQANPPPKNREQIGEVLGAPVFRDQVNDENLHQVFLSPIEAKYRNAHRAAIAPTENEIKYATEVFDQKHRERLVAEGGESKIRDRLQAIEDRLARPGLPEEEERKLESEHHLLRTQLKPPGRSFAEFMLNQWKFQRRLYDEFGGGRILWQQGGQEAFDATRMWLESLENQGEFRISDPALRAKLYDYWTRDHGPFLTSDKNRIRKEFLEPEWVEPAATKP
jgi:hypothetical protein